MWYCLWRPWSQFPHVPHHIHSSSRHTSNLTFLLLEIECFYIYCRQDQLPTWVTPRSSISHLLCISSKHFCNLQLFPSTFFNLSSLHFVLKFLAIFLIGRGIGLLEGRKIIKNGIIKIDVREDIHRKWDCCGLGNEIVGKQVKVNRKMPREIWDWIR